MLGRMHVDVDQRGIELEEQHERGMPTMEQHVRVRLAHCVRDETIAHETTVDVEILLVRLRA